MSSWWRPKIEVAWILESLCEEVLSQGVTLTQSGCCMSKKGIFVVSSS